MNEIPLGALFGILFFLLILSAFFSSSETGMMALDRYRLRHKVNEGDKGAVRVSRLLEKPDRLIGVILLGNNFVNILASSIATIIALRLMGESGIAVAAGLLTLVVLIFSEVAPKTMAALYPEKVAYPASLVLRPLLRILSPLVAVVNFVANNFLKLFGVNNVESNEKPLTSDELRSIVLEAGHHMSAQYQQMLLQILDLKDVSVNHIMVPRHEIVGLDLELSLEEILETIKNTPYTRLPVYEDTINNIKGILHIRDLLPLLRDEPNITKQTLVDLARESYFIPEVANLSQQLTNFRQRKERMGLVVDEYGDIEGLTTIDDILEEIVGKFTSDVADDTPDVIKHKTSDTFLVDAGIYVRELNKEYELGLPEDGPSTLNGLLLEHFESIPPEGTSILIEGYPIEILETSQMAIERVKIMPQIEQSEDNNDEY